MDAFESLRRHGLAFPEAEEDFPWGHSALKVRGNGVAPLVPSDGGQQARLHVQAPEPVGNVGR